MEMMNWLKHLYLGYRNEDYKTETDDVKSNSNSLRRRMTSLIRSQNGKKCHPYRTHVISLKSKGLLSFLNKTTDVEQKIKMITRLNESMVNVCKRLYARFNPTMIYQFNNEIHLVFNYNDLGDFLYDGDITKTLTKIVSSATLYSTQELLQDTSFDKVNDIIFSGTFVQFKEDYEILNYIIWRQYDCKRNNITLLYRCEQGIDQVEEGLKLADMEASLKTPVPETILYGNIIKKEIVYKEVDVPNTINEFIPIGDLDSQTQFVTRKQIRVMSFGLYNENSFKENYIKFVRNAIL